ncbi:unnamed protein product [Aphanomyces euteiches]|nr:hypothetical protein AeRB84_017550 [Aphanomyces euteiches]
MVAAAQSLTHMNPSHSLPAEDSTCGATNYRMIAQVILKETESGRDNKGNVFGPQVFEGSSFSSIKEKLWTFTLEYLQPLAHYTGLPKVWSIQTAPPTMCDFDKYVSFKHNKQIISTDDKLKKRLQKNPNETITVLTYKWGVNIRSTSDLIEFKKTCIEPVSVDRAGAADEEQQQEIVEQLRHYWADHYDAFDATWRMWASLIHAKRAQYNVSREVQRPPPAQLIHLFTATTSGIHSRLDELDRNIKMAMDTVDSCIEDYKAIEAYWKTCVDSMEIRLDAFKKSLETKKKCLESFARDLPCRRDTETAQFTTIPNIPDNDHAYEYEGEDDEMN